MAKLNLSNPTLLFGIELIETGYAPRNVALLIGRRDGSIHYYGKKMPAFDFGKELIGKIDFNTGEMELIKGATIQEIRADEPTMDKLKSYLKEEQS